MNDENISKKSFENKSLDSWQFQEKMAEEPPSIISLFFDQLNFKGLLKGIFKKTPIKITDHFIDAILLFSFLFLILYPLGILKFWSYHTILLVAIGMAAFLEFFISNTTFFKKYFAMEKRTEIFLEKIPSMTKGEIKADIQTLNFSSKCINHFLKSIENNKYPPYFIDLIIDTQNLRKANLDLLTNPIILNFIRPELMIKICYKYKDSLTYENIENIYCVYKNNDELLKILFARQIDSYFLTQNHPENNKLTELYNRYQINRIHIDKTLKIIPISHFQVIRKYILLSLFFGFLILFILSFEINNTLIRTEDIFGIFFGSLLLTGLIIGIIVDPLILKMQKFYYKRFTNNILKIK